MDKPFPMPSQTRRSMSQLSLRVENIYGKMLHGRAAKHPQSSRYNSLALCNDSHLQHEKDFFHADDISEKANSSSVLHSGGDAVKSASPPRPTHIDPSTHKTSKSISQLCLRIRKNVLASKLYRAGKLLLLRYKRLENNYLPVKEENCGSKKDDDSGGPPLPPGRNQYFFSQLRSNSGVLSKTLCDLLQTNGYINRKSVIYICNVLYNPNKY
jgi:hypothetical protein